MIPAFDPHTGTLPRGIHDANWSEVVEALGFSPSRRLLLDGLLSGCLALRSAGAGVVFIDGSFATSKRNPKDFDCCYWSRGIDSSKLDPVLLDIEPERIPMKETYKGEFLPAELPIETGMFAGSILDWFQRDPDHNYKGIVKLNLATLP